MDEAGPYTGRGNSNEWGKRHADVLRRIMDADFAVIEKSYDRACHLSATGGEYAHGRAPLQSFWIGLRSALPEAEFRIDHQIGRTDPLMPPRSAIRWYLTGAHSGWVSTAGRLACQSMSWVSATLNSAPVASAEISRSSMTSQFGNKSS